MENFYPHVVKRINKEICEVLNENIEGIEILVNEQDSIDIQAIINGPEGTPYEGGRFHVKLVLTEGYPMDPPKGYFYTKIFHPNIAPATGEICVNTLKRDWKSDLGLKHILLVIRCLLLDPNPESALNEEAGRLLLEDYNEYVAQARLYTDVHACHHLRKSKQAKDNCEGDALGILRDANAPSSKKPLGKPATQRHISATKKALKRL